GEAAVRGSPEGTEEFDAIRSARYSADFPDPAVAWLSSRSLLEKVPKFEAGITDEAEFARKLETVCGPAAKGALQSEYGPHVLNPEWVQELLQPPRGGDEAAIPCLFAAAYVAGFALGF